MYYNSVKIDAERITTYVRTTRYVTCIKVKIDIIYQKYEEMFGKILKILGGGGSSAKRIRSSNPKCFVGKADQIICMVHHQRISTPEDRKSLLGTLAPEAKQGPAATWRCSCNISEMRIRKV